MVFQRIPALEQSYTLRGYMPLLRIHLTEKTSLQETMKDEESRIYGYAFISKANSKFFPQKFTLSRAARADTNP